MDKDQNTSLQDLMRQLHHIQQEIDTHHRMKNVRKRPKRPKTVYYGVALAKKGNQGVYTDYPTVQRIKPMVWRKFTTKEKATHYHQYVQPRTTAESGTPRAGGKVTATRTRHYGVSVGHLGVLPLVVSQRHDRE